MSVRESTFAFDFEVEFDSPLYPPISPPSISIDMYCNGSKKCRQCDVVLNRSSEIRLCSICTVLGYLLSKDALPGVIDDTFVNRDLKMSYEGYKHVSTKVYTCHDCLGPKHFSNPFLFCFRCLLKRYPDCLDKMTVLPFLRMTKLTDDAIVMPLIRRCCELRRERRHILKAINYEMGSDYRSMKFMVPAENGGGCTILIKKNGETVTKFVACIAHNADDSEPIDTAAVKKVVDSRVAKLVESGMIVDLAKLAVDMEGHHPAVKPI
jgi:hypothetical protein